MQGADVWAFSVLLYELITGKAAFAGMNHAQVLPSAPFWVLACRVLGCRWASYQPVLRAGVRRQPMASCPPPSVRSAGDAHVLSNPHTQSICVAIPSCWNTCSSSSVRRLGLLTRGARAQVIHQVAILKRRLEVPADAPRALRALAERCMAIDPSQRSTFDQVKAELAQLRAALPAP